MHPTCVPLPARRRPAVGAALVAAGLAFSGCAMGPDYKRPEVPLPAAWRAPVAEVAEVAEVADVVDTAWWQAFGDAELTGLVDAALQANKDLRIATLRVEEFRARLQSSGAARYPQVGYALGGQRSRHSQEQPQLLRPGAEPTFNTFSIGSDLSWEIDLWGRVRRANEAALADLLATEEARRAVMLSVVSSVADAYVQLLGLDQQLALARETLKNRESALNLLQLKQQGGAATGLAVAQARALVDQAAAALPPIEREIATVEHALSLLVGRNPGAVKRGSIDSLALPPVPQGVPSDVLSRRPDVMAAEQELAAASARIGVARSQHLPTVSLTGALGLASDELRWLWAHTARTGALGVGAAGSLFAGGRIEAGVRQAEAVHGQQQQRYLQTVQTALKEVEDALVFRARAGEHFDALGRNVVSLQEVARLSQMRFDGGESNFLEVLDAQRQVFAAQRLQAQARRDQYLSLISIYRAMGGGWMVKQDQAHPGIAPSAPAPAWWEGSARSSAAAKSDEVAP